MLQHKSQKEHLKTRGVDWKDITESWIDSAPTQKKKQKKGIGEMDINLGSWTEMLQHY